MGVLDASVARAQENPDDLVGKDPTATASRFELK
jgi:hypothetical protein